VETKIASGSRIISPWMVDVGDQWAITSHYQIYGLFSVDDQYGVLPPLVSSRKKICFILRQMISVPNRAFSGLDILS